MKANNLIEEIHKLVSEADFCISYNPIHKEIDPVTLPLNLPDIRYIIPIDPNNNPKTFGADVTKKFKGLNGFILVPGRKFDQFGGRHGRGQGWYDRFLSSIPSSFIRIGICSKEQFSRSRLILQEWDELMDWIIVEDNGLFTFYKTSARVLPNYRFASQLR